jgi:hypothetical protein
MVTSPFDRRARKERPPFKVELAKTQKDRSIPGAPDHAAVAISARAFDGSQNRCLRRIRDRYRKTYTFVANGFGLWAPDVVSHRCSDRSTRWGSSSRLNVPAEDRQRIELTFSTSVLGRTSRRRQAAAQEVQ